MNGKELQAARKARGLTQAELGKLVGRSRDAIQRWESGDATPKNQVLARLFEVFATNPVIVRATPAEIIAVRNRYGITYKLMTEILHIHPGRLNAMRRGLVVITPEFTRKLRNTELIQRGIAHDALNRAAADMARIGRTDLQAEVRKLIEKI